MPLHEIHERFTRSELFLMAWRSQEQNFNLNKRIKKYENRSHEGYVSNEHPHYGANDIIPEGLPSHFFNEEGEVDLSRVTGMEARKYMQAIGIPMPVMNTGRPNPTASISDARPA